MFFPTLKSSTDVCLFLTRALRSVGIVIFLTVHLERRLGGVGTGWFGGREGRALRIWPLCFWRGPHIYLLPPPLRRSLTIRVEFHLGGMGTRNPVCEKPGFVLRLNMFATAAPGGGKTRNPSGNVCPANFPEWSPWRWPSYALVVHQVSACKITRRLSLAWQIPLHAQHCKSQVVHAQVRRILIPAYAV